MKDVDLALLRTFEALVREGSVAGAARRLGRSQPAISRELAALRVQIDDPILIRTKAGMEVTARASAIAARALPRLEALRADFQATAAFEPYSSTAAFRISIGDYESAVLLPFVLARFGAEAPQASIAIHHRRRPDVEGSLLDGEIQLAIGRFVNPQPHLHAQTLFRDAFRLCVRRGHPIASGPVTLEGVLAYPHFLVSPGGNGERSGMFDQALTSQGRSRSVRLATPHFLASPLLLQDSDAVAILPVRLASLFSQLEQLPLPRAFRPEGFDIGMLWHRRVEQSPDAIWLRGLFVESAQALAPVADDGDGATF